MKSIVAFHGACLRMGEFEGIWAMLFGTRTAHLSLITVTSVPNPSPGGIASSIVRRSEISKSPGDRNRTPSSSELTQMGQSLVALCFQSHKLEQSHIGRSFRIAV
jgi:hypothetical protein